MPTIKQKMAFQRAIRNGGNVSKAMVDVGYSNNTAHTPQKLTDSIGFTSKIPSSRYKKQRG